VSAAFITEAFLAGHIVVRPPSMTSDCPVM
jgi:hypothetical protein